jgi:hypothetical protein
VRLLLEEERTTSGIEEKKDEYCAVGIDLEGESEREGERVLYSTQYVIPKS